MVQAYALARVRTESSTIEGLFDAFQHNTPVPSRDAFVKSLGNRVRDDWDDHLRLRLETD